ASLRWNLAQHPADTHLFLMSNRLADGRDVSWFWDIDLRGVRYAMVAGERALEMLIRLRYEPAVQEAQAFSHKAEAFAAALARTPPGGRVLVVATYSNLAPALKLLRALSRPRASSRRGTAAAGEPLAAARLPVHRPRACRQKVVRIGLLCPDQLGTYADSGNAVVLQRRLEWRGVSASVIRVAAGDTLGAQIDVLLLGGGEDRGQRLALAALRPLRAALKAMLEDGVPALLVCGGFQLYGQSLPLGAEEVAGLGLLPLVTRPGARRLVGGIGVRSTLLAEPLVGFENHRGCSALLDGARPFGSVLWGNGNGPEGSADEGLVLHRTIGTYAHGPVLARNPDLAEVMLGWVAERRGFSPFEPLDDGLEHLSAAHRA
ncbi:MurT ligase domain-containing protein, partial [Acidisoma sp. C75]